MASRSDDTFLHRAMALAQRGRGLVEPNPMVGCVIVRDDRVIGEGYHEKFGGPHAEPSALAACTESPAGATAYVTLEPCCHTNKKMPPCVPKLIEAKLSRIVVGTLDPNPQVSGGGVEQLRAAGIRCDVLDLPSARQLIAPFIATTVYRRPYVTLKWAESSDGKVAGPPGRRLRISNQRSWQLVHELRSRFDAILVGINTVLADDPLLTVRGVAPCRPLRRIVLSRDLAIPLSARLVKSASDTPVEIFCSPSALQEKAYLAGMLESSGIRVTPVAMDSSGRLDLAQVLGELGARGITNLLVEPGPTLARSFIDGNLADRVWIFRSPHPAPEPGSMLGVGIEYPKTARLELEGDVLTEYLNPASNLFFAPDTSPDLTIVAGASPS